MKKISILLIVAAAFFSSCSTYQYTARQTFVNNQNIVASPTVVDVSADYAKRITATSRSCKTQTEAMQEAKYMAIVDNKIDILVDMIYKIEKKGLLIRPFYINKIKNLYLLRRLKTVIIK